MSPLTERELFDAALDLPPEDRSAYLVRVCADDAMRQRVEALGREIARDREGS